MILVDTNVIIDIFDRDPIWFEWSAGRLSEAAGEGEVAINAVVVAELSRSFKTLAALQQILLPFELQSRALDDASAFLAGKRFQEYRRTRQGVETARVLPDFLIGAQAIMLGATLLTRDARLYRRYFPDLTLLTPET